LARYTRPKNKRVEDILIEKGLQSKEKLIKKEKEIYSNYQSPKTVRIVTPDHKFGTSR